MAFWNDLKTAVSSIVKPNGNLEIQGQNMQDTLISIINSVGEDATFVGIANKTTSPGIPDGPKFYIAIEIGLYPNFSGIEINASSVINWNGSSWDSFAISNTPLFQSTKLAFIKEIYFLEAETYRLSYTSKAGILRCSFRDSLEVEYITDDLLGNDPSGVYNITSSGILKGYIVIDTTTIASGTVGYSDVLLRNDLAKCPIINSYLSSEAIQKGIRDDIFYFYNIADKFISKLNGNAQASVEHDSTDFIYLNRDVDIELFLYIKKSDNTTPCAFYDKNGVFISSYDKAQIPSDGSQIVTILIADFPDDAIFFRSCTERLSDEFYINNGALYINLNKIAKESIIEVSGIANVSGRMVDLYNVPDRFVSKVDGLDYPSTEHDSTDFIYLNRDVDIELFLYIKKSDNTTPCAFYDKNGVFISSYDKAQIPSDGSQIVTILIADFPADAILYRVCTERLSDEFYIKNSTSNINLTKVLRSSIALSTGVVEYNTLFQALEQNRIGASLIGSTLVNHNQTSFDMPDTGSDYDPEIVSKQFNILGGGGISLQKRKGAKISTAEVSGNELSILSFSDNYIYAVNTNTNEIYRFPFVRGIELITPLNVPFDKLLINYPLPNQVILGNVHNIIELKDGNVLLEMANGADVDGYIIHNTYKLSLGVENEVSGINEIDTSAIHLIELYKATQVYSDWSIKQHGNIVIIGPYGFGVTAQIFLSDDYGDTFTCIFNVADVNKFVDTRPDGAGGYGSTGIHPEPSNIIPSQVETYWDVTTGNGNVHIHSIAYDEYFNRLWMTMGDSLPDSDKYTAIYYSDDLGRTWNRIGLNGKYPDTGSGNQLLNLTVTKDCVLFGTDGFGNGIYRYARKSKDETPIIEMAYRHTLDAGSLLTVGQGVYTDSNGITYMSYAPNSGGSVPSYEPNGGIVATNNGYDFSLVYEDEFNQGNNATARLVWHSLFVVVDGRIYIRGNNKSELIII